MVTNSARMGEQFDTAHAAWMAGDWREAQKGAKSVLSEAIAVRERRFQARASSLLAQVLSLQSRFGLAAQFATRARDLFSGLHDPAGVSEAMLGWSYAESARGHADDAAAAAEQVIAGARDAQKRTAGGLTYRGVAAAWRGDYGTARAVLDAACQIAPEECERGASAFHPLVNTLFTEVLRCADLRMQGHGVELSELESLLATTWQLANAGSTTCLVPVSTLPGLFLLSFASCFHASRTGQSARADKYYLKCLQYASQLPESSWMQALTWWARLERTVAAGEVQEAAVSASRMLLVASEGEHEPLKALTRKVASEAQNYFAGAASPYATYM